MILTQYELSGPERKVFWLNTGDGTLSIGDQLELIETPGVTWTVTQVCTSLPNTTLAGIPHRIGTRKH